MAKHSSISTTAAALAWLLTFGATAWAAPSVRLAMADQPVRVIRAADVYQAVNGTPLEQDDIVETGAGGAQLELDSGTIVAVGPQTRLYLSAIGAAPKGSTELALLQGWIKVQTGAGRAMVAAEALQASVGGGAVVVFSRPGRDALFADSGEQLAAPVTGPGKAGPMQKVASESYVQADAGKPLVMQPRADPQFLRDMPPPFRDRLAPAPQPAKPVKVPAQRQRAVDFADVEGWLRCSLAVRKHFVARFHARLQDPRFRQQLDQALGHGSEWQAVLHPVVKHPSTP